MRDLTGLRPFILAVGAIAYHSFPLLDVVVTADYLETPRAP